MIVCSCNVISDQDIRHAVSTADELPRNSKDVYGCLGGSAACGRCARTIKTIVGDIKYGANGEWIEGRVLTLQFHDVKGSDIDQWKTDEKQTILWPPQYATGKAIYPYSAAKK